MPTHRTAVGALARALTRLEANPFPSRLDGPTRGMVEAMVPYQPFVQRLVTANLWLTSHQVMKLLQANPLGAALLPIGVSAPALDKLYTCTPVSVAIAT